jgi:RNA polymerase sigma factor (sigma-70 family)
VSTQSRNILTDRQLVERVLGGDAKAFGLLVRDTEGLVAQIVYKLIPNEEDRKDMAQDIYLKAFYHLKGFKFQSRLSTWVAQIAYNTCINWRQKKKLVLATDLGGGPEGQGRDRSGQSAGMAAPDTEGLVVNKQLSGILQVGINQLPPLYATLVSLYHHEELSYQEMAEITGLPEGTVKSYLFRARKMLKETLLSTYKKEAL